MTTRSPSGRFIHWTEIIRKCKRADGGWLLFFSNQSTRTAAAVRLKRHPDLRRDDGELQVRVTSRYVDEAGVERGDLWLRWRATIKQPDTKEQAIEREGRQ
jgi:hypothetical protein